MVQFMSVSWTVAKVLQRPSGAAALEKLPNARQDGAYKFTTSTDRFFDDLTGLPLPEELCKAARIKDIDYFRSKGVWELRPISEARAQMGRNPISVRWVETDNGDDMNPNIRSRLVAREIRMAGEDAIFAPTPPLESLRMVLRYAATNLPTWKPHVRTADSEDRTQLLLIDISRAYFNAKTDDDDPIYVQLPPELGAPEGMCGLLRRHMYGTRRAAEGWEDEYNATLIDLGFTQGSASPCVFSRQDRGIIAAGLQNKFLRCSQDICMAPTSQQECRSELRLWKCRSCDP